MRLHASESDIERQIIDGLRWCGFTVLKTSRQRRKCPTCGTYAHRGDGVDRGVPDLLARHPSWPDGVWVGLEVKNATGRLSPEQMALREKRGIHVVRSFEEAREVLEQAEPQTQGRGGVRAPEERSSALPITKRG